MPTVSEYIDGIDEPLASVARSLRAIIEKGLPRSAGSVQNGHPVWMNGDLIVAGIRATPECVTVLLWEGQNAGDHAGELTAGSPGNMATKDYASVNEIESEKLNAWLTALDVT